MTDNAIKVSVLMLAYNHEKYIAQAIEGVMMQQADFDYELVIGEDHSTDDTLSICLKYQEKFPDKIRVLQRPENLGMYKNFESTYLACKGQYIAHCEGDDYFTDPKKLQVQVDFLDRNPEFIISFHPAKEISLDGTSFITNQNQKPVTDITDIVRGWYIRTATYMYRGHLVKQFPEWFFHATSNDHCFHVLLAQNGGKIGFMDRTMSVYRRNEGGITHNNNIDYIKYLRRSTRFYELMHENLPNAELRSMAAKVIQGKEEALFYALRAGQSPTLKDRLEIVRLGLRLNKFLNVFSFLNRKIRGGV